MAAGRDIKRQTILIRREQARRNAEAVAEAEARRTAMTEQQTSDRRRRKNVVHTPTMVVKRDGHRVKYEARSALEEVSFASKAAKELAEEAAIEVGVFEDYEPSSAKGFTTKDVRSILEDIEEDEDEDDDDEDDDEDDEDEYEDDDEEEEEEEDDDEEKMDDSDYEDKMDRKGENK